MLKIVLTLILLSPLMFPAPVLAIRQVDYLGRIDIKKPVKVVVDSPRERIFVFSDSSEISVVSLEGEDKFTFGGKDDKKEWILKNPSDLVIVGETIYVTDASLHRVTLFSLDGKNIGSFGEKGDDPGQLSSPGAITAFKNVIYVADTGNGRIQVFSLDGVLLQILADSASSDDGIERPVDIEVDAQRNLIVLDSKSNLVHVYDIEGRIQGKFSGINKPIAIALDAEGIYVADSDEYKVTKHGYNGDELFSFGGRGKGDSQFSSVSDVAINSKGEVFVADSSRGTIQKFLPELDYNGLEVDSAPAVTSVVGESYIANTVADKVVLGKSGLVYTVDFEGKSVQVFNNGEIKETIQIPKVYPVGIAEGPTGTLYLLDKKKSRVLILDEDRRVQGEFGSGGSDDGKFSRPSDILVSSQGVVLILDTGNDRIQAFNDTGIFLKSIEKSKEGEKYFDHPVAFSIAPDDSIFVVDDAKKCIIFFDKEGDFLRVVGDSKTDSYFEQPVSIVAGENQFFVLDQQRSEIMIFSHEGSLLRSFAAMGMSGFEQPIALTMLTPISMLVSGNNEKISSVSKYTLHYTPDSPVGLNAKAGMRTVKLTWDTLPQNYIDKYIIYRKEPDTDRFQIIAESSRNSYTDTDVKPSKTYSYLVTAHAIEGNEGERSAEVSTMPLKAKVGEVSGMNAEPHEWSVGLSWVMEDTDFVTKYRIYQKIDGNFVQIEEITETSYQVVNLESDVDYSFAVSAVSIDRVESKKMEIVAKTLVATRPPLEIEVVELDNIFSNNYKIYESEGLGTVKLVNNTRNHISKVVVSFQLKVFMDFPWELEIENLMPEESREINIKAVFNNRILEVSEDTPVQAELIASYYRNEDKLSYPSKHTLNVYEKHKMIWSEEGMFASFITPKDPVVLEFIRSIVTQFPEFSSSLVRAGIVFESLGVYGLTYIPDPNNPYQTMSKQVEQVDYVQYPRETLKRKSGDCDDLVGLYSASLESLGIKTKAVAIPGHMFMMLSTGVDKNQVADDSAGMFVVHEDQLWVPIEVTVVGQPFMKAWETGVKNYFEWEGRGLSLFDFRDSWAYYKPANLPAPDWNADTIARDKIEGEYPNSLKTLNRIEAMNVAWHFRRALKENPADSEALLQVGIIYAKAGELGEAEKVLLDAEKYDPENSSVVNSLGNLYYLKEDTKQAVEYYRRAVELDQDDADLWVNLARGYLAADMKEEAEAAFREAVDIDAKISTRYRTLSFKLLSSF